METSSPPRPAIDLPSHLYYQLVYTLTDLLPPPLDDTPQALRTRNLAAIAKVAALLPVNANEADLAAQCIAARAQAEDTLRLLRQHAGDIGVVMRLNAQYASMLRTSLSLHGRLMRVQALRQKREAIEAAANQDAWTLHVAERSMVGVVAPDAGPPQPAWPEAGLAQMATVATQPTSPEGAPAACLDQRTKKHISENEINSHDAALETRLSAQPWTWGGSDEAYPREVVREAITKSRSAKSPTAGRSLPANSRDNPARADHGQHINGETAST
jgi:hypothetical protein